MEHASVAAFARFTLQLLSVGAPAELVRAANDALGDEITHAKLCFGLASVYAGRRIGPGPLSMQHALDDASFIDIVTTAVAEACIGETLAAAEAAEASEHAVDPDVRAALTTIARDEARHAELGWKFLRWALARADGTTRALLVERLRALIDDAVTRVQLDAEPAHEAADAAIRLEHGVLTNALKREAHRAVLREVVRPLAHALSKASSPVLSAASP